jgi:hypothetical protein
MDGVVSTKLYDNYVGTAFCLFPSDLIKRSDNPHKDLRVGRGGRASLRLRLHG